MLPRMWATASFLVTVWAAITLVFLLPRVLPGDPLAVVTNETTATLTDPSARAELERYYGLDRPMIEQYWSFLGGALTGDLGSSISRKAPVRELILARLPWTALLVVPALAISSVVSFIAGVMAAWRRGRAGDHLLLTVTTILRGIPDFAIGFALLVLFAVVLPWFPLSGARTPFSEGDPLLSQALDIVHHAALPVSTLVLSLLGAKFLLARSSMVSILGQDYIVAARAKGLPRWRVRYRHGSRNALAPFLAQLGVQTGFVIGGAVFVEQVFNYPGLGSLLLEAVDARDYPLLDGCFLTLSIIVLLANAAAGRAARPFAVGPVR